MDHTNKNKRHNRNHKIHHGSFSYKKLPIHNLFVKPSVILLGPKRAKNYKTSKHIMSFCPIRRLHAHAMIDVTCFPAFVVAYNLISSVM